MFYFIPPPPPPLTSFSPPQRYHLAKTSKLLQQQRRQLKHYRDIYRLKQTDLEFKKIADINHKPPVKFLAIDTRRCDVERGDQVDGSRRELEEAAAHLYSIVECGNNFPPFVVVGPFGWFLF